MDEPALIWVPTEDIHPNPWNPNAMDPEMFGKAVESIHQFGFIDPVTCRETNDGLQIVDGEHRHRAGREHSGLCVRDGDGSYIRHVPMGTLPVFNIGRVDDVVAKQLTIVLNETRGSFDPKKMGALLTELVAIEPLPELLTVLPFSEDRFRELAELPTVNWDEIKSSPAATSGKRDERWVERVYRLPAEAAQALDEAVRAARDEPGTPDWRALQTIAEHFLGT